MKFELTTEKELILQQITIIERLGSIIPRSFKNSHQISQLRIILKLIEKHLLELQEFGKKEDQSEKYSKIYPYVQANTRIKNHVLRKGFQIRQMLESEVVAPFVNLALKSLTRILFGLDCIQKKIKKGQYFTPLVLSENKPFHYMKMQSHKDTNDL